MTALPLTLMVFARVVVLTLGIVITVLGFRAYRRRRTRYLRKAVIGFGIVTVGIFLEGILYHVASVDLVTVHIVESVLVSAGFLVILASLR